MKIFICFLFVAWASAFPHDELNAHDNEPILNALEDIEPYVLSADRFGDDIERGIKELNLFQRIKEAVEDKDDMQLVNQEDVVDEDLLRLTHFDHIKRNIHSESLTELNIKDILRKIKEHLRKNVDPELVKEKIEKLFGKGTELLEQLLKTLKEKGRKKLMILIDNLLDDDDSDTEKRGIKDYWEKVKNYFKDLKIDLQEKYMKFGEWVKDALDKGMEHSKDKMENIRAIAREFGKHAKNVSKEVAVEAKEFFRQYKEELGNVWEELKETIKEIMNRNN